MPVQLVDLRAALTDYLDSPEPRHVAAYRDLGNAFQRWYVYFNRECRRL